MKKEFILIVIFIIVIISLLVYGFNRLEKIDNGEIKVISESLMD